MIKSLKEYGKNSLMAVKSISDDRGVYFRIENKNIANGKKDNIRKKAA